MIFINPQWQGSGFTDELRIGAEILKLYYKALDITEVPLSGSDFTMVDNIKCFNPVLEQANSFKNIVTDKRPQKMSTIGGDCGIELIPVSYLNKIYQEDICFIWIDAHADLNTPESSPSKTFHGMPLRTLLGDGNQQFRDLLFSSIRPEQICFVGLRDLDEPESEYIADNNITSLPNCKFAAVQNKIKNFKHIYIHLDLDVLDKSEFAFTMTPTSNGFKINEVAQLIKKLKEDYEVVGICITESIATNLEQLAPIKPILDQIEL